MKNFSLEESTTIKGWFETKELKEAIGAISKALETDTGTFEVVISTENLDRYNEVIKLDGWELDHYMNNPVVLWSHDHTKLIGMATSVFTMDGKLVAKGKFAPNALGQETRRLYESGFLKATSVGFIPKDQEGSIITKAELLEFSFVSVPANPYALSLAMEKELDINELVTKGFMNIKEAEPVLNEEEQDEEEDQEPEIPNEPEEKKFSTKAITSITEQLKGIITALEALETEPEREEEAVVAPEDEKAFADFKQKKVVQEAATIIGAVLAEWRQKEEA